MRHPRRALSQTFSVGSRDESGSYKPLPTHEHEITCTEENEGAGRSEPNTDFDATKCGHEASCADSAFPDSVGKDDEENPMESMVMQSVMIGMIVSNAVVIGFETDLPHAFRWDIVENVFLVGFTVELTVRLYYNGFCEFFKFRNNPELTWNILDFVIVTAGLFNVFLSLFAPGKHGGEQNNATLFRIVRLMRILRVLRIIRIVRFLKQLYLLAYGFAEGALAVFWVTLLASFLLYICSVILVRTYGHTLPEDNEDADFFHEKFGNIPRTMFALFELISSPDLSPYRAIMFKNPPLVVFLTMFIILGSFGINGLLVALINESILEKNQARLESDRMDREMKRKQLQQKCRELFDSLDVRGSRVLPRSELQRQTAKLASIFQSLGVNFHRKDLEQIFYVMDCNDTGIIERSEFEQGVLELCDQIRPMSIMELHYQVSKCVSKIEATDSKIEQVARGFDEHDAVISTIQRKVDDVWRATDIKPREFPPPSAPGRASDLRPKEAFAPRIPELRNAFSGLSPREEKQRSPHSPHNPSPRRLSFSQDQLPLRMPLHGRRQSSPMSSPSNGRRRLSQTQIRPQDLEIERKSAISTKYAERQVLVDHRRVLVEALDIIDSILDGNRDEGTRACVGASSSTAGSSRIEEGVELSRFSDRIFAIQHSSLDVLAALYSQVHGSTIQASKALTVSMDTAAGPLPASATPAPPSAQAASSLGRQRTEPSASKPDAASSGAEASSLADLGQAPVDPLGCRVTDALIVDPRESLLDVARGRDSEREPPPSARLPVPILPLGSSSSGGCNSVKSNTAVAPG